MKFLMRLTGGRPMKMQYHAFVDKVRNKDIYVFKDVFGRYFLAENSMSSFRVNITKEHIEKDAWSV